MIKKFLISTLIALLATSALAQNAPNFGSIMTPNAAIPTGLPPTGAAGGSLAGTYPNPSLAAINSIGTSLTIGGATIGTDALAWTGTATGSGSLTAGSFIPTSSTVPTNGMYLSGANSIGFATNSGARWFINSGGTLNATSTSGAALTAGATSSTAPVFTPNRGDLTTGIGAQAAGNISMIVGATERARIATGAASVSDILLPGTLFTGGTGTTTFPQILVQPTGTTAVTTWSTSGTIFGANVVSGFAGNFIDFHVAGGASVFNVTSAGRTIVSTTANTNGISIISGGVTGSNTTQAGIFVNGTLNTSGVIQGVVLASNMTTTATGAGTTLIDLRTSSLGLVFATTSTGNVIAQAGYGFNSDAGVYRFGAASDVILSRAASASLQLGAADAASPVAQTLRAQSVVAGTANTASVNTTIIGSLATGSGTNGNLIFQVGVSPGAGSTQATATTALTITGESLTASFVGPIIGNGSVFAGTSSYLAISGKSRFSSASDGTMMISNAAASDFSRLQFGGTTSSFPAIKRSTTSLQARLADDSAFTNIQGKLTTDTAYTAGVQVPTGYITIYDSTGTPYKVSVNP